MANNLVLPGTSAYKTSPMDAVQSPAATLVAQNLQATAPPVTQMQTAQPTQQGPKSLSDYIADSQAWNMQQQAQQNGATGTVGVAAGGGAVPAGLEQKDLYGANKANADIQELATKYAFHQANPDIPMKEFAVDPKSQYGKLMDQMKTMQFISQWNKTHPDMPIPMPGEKNTYTKKSQEDFGIFEPQTPWYAKDTKGPYNNQDSLLAQINSRNVYPNYDNVPFHRSGDEKPSTMLGDMKSMLGAPVKALSSGLDQLTSDMMGTPVPDKSSFLSIIQNPSRWADEWPIGSDPGMGPPDGYTKVNGRLEALPDLSGSNVIPAPVLSMLSQSQPGRNIISAVRQAILDTGATDKDTITKYLAQKGTPLPDFNSMLSGAYYPNAAGGPVNGSALAMQAGLYPYLAGTGEMQRNPYLDAQLKVAANRQGIPDDFATMELQQNPQYAAYLQQAIDKEKENARLLRDGYNGYGAQ
jgi:hypothetical protein